MAIAMPKSVWPFVFKYPTVWDSIDDYDMNIGKNENASKKYMYILYLELINEGYSDKVAKAFIECARRIVDDDKTFDIHVDENLSIEDITDKYIDDVIPVYISNLVWDTVQYMEESSKKQTEDDEIDDDINNNFTDREIKQIFFLLLTNRSMQPVYEMDNFNNSLNDIIRGIISRHINNIIKTLGPKGSDESDIWYDLVSAIEDYSLDISQEHLKNIFKACELTVEHNITIDELKLLWLYSFNSNKNKHKYTYFNFNNQMKKDVALLLYNELLIKALQTDSYELFENNINFFDNYYDNKESITIPCSYNTNLYNNYEEFEDDEKERIRSLSKLDNIIQKNYSNKEQSEKVVRAESNESDVVSEAVSKEVSDEAKGAPSNKNSQNKQYEIIENYFKINASGDPSSSIQLNKISWHSNQPKYDLRKWYDIDNPGKGFTLSLQDILELQHIINNCENMILKPIVVDCNLHKKACIKELYGVIDSQYDWPLNICLVEMGGITKYDIRRWEPNYENYGVGIRLTSSEFDSLKSLLNDFYQRLYVPSNQIDEEIDKEKQEELEIKELQEKNVEEEVNGKSAQEIYDLGLKYEDITGDDGQNLLKAAYCFKLAAESNHQDAIYRIGYFTEFGMGGYNQDINDAVKYYESAANLGSVEALYALGRINDEGKNGSRNRLAAEAYYQYAAEKGHTAAQIKLAELRQETGLE